MCYRLNLLLLINELFFIYFYNKIREWFESFSVEDKYKMIEEVRKEGKEFRKLFYNWFKEI